MAKTTREESDRIVEHPLEEAFEIEAGTTLVPHVERSTQLVVAESYDEKDTEIEDQFQEVYDAAMEAFDQSSGRLHELEGKYRARNEEVAVQYLNTALQAAREKSGQKQHKDKIGIAEGKIKGNQKVTNNNLTVADHKELMRIMDEAKKQKEDDGVQEE